MQHIKSRRRQDYDIILVYLTNLSISPKLTKSWKSGFQASISILSYFVHVRKTKRSSEKMPKHCFIPHPNIDTNTSLYLTYETCKSHCNLMSRKAEVHARYHSNVTSRRTQTNTQKNIWKNKHFKRNFSTLTKETWTQYLKIKHNKRDFSTLTNET